VNLLRLVPRRDVQFATLGLHGLRVTPKLLAQCTVGHGAQQRDGGFVPDQFDERRVTSHQRFPILCADEAEQPFENPAAAFAWRICLFSISNTGAVFLNFASSRFGFEGQDRVWRVLPLGRGRAQPARSL
jgi:hypothetical protein